MEYTEVDVFYPVFFPPPGSPLNLDTERAANVRTSIPSQKNRLQLSYFSFSPI